MRHPGSDELFQDRAGAFFASRNVCNCVLPRIEAMRHGARSRYSFDARPKSEAPSRQSAKPIRRKPFRTASRPPARETVSGAQRGERSYARSNRTACSAARRLALAKTRSRPAVSSRTCSKAELNRCTGSSPRAKTPRGAETSDWKAANEPVTCLKCRHGPCCVRTDVESNQRLPARSGGRASYA